MAPTGSPPRGLSPPHTGFAHLVTLAPNSSEARQTGGAARHPCAADWPHSAAAVRVIWLFSLQPRASFFHDNFFLPLCQEKEKWTGLCRHQPPFLVLKLNCGCSGETKGELGAELKVSSAWRSRAVSGCQWLARNFFLPAIPSIAS